MLDILVILAVLIFFMCCVPGTAYIWAYWSTLGKLKAMDNKFSGGE